MSSASHSPESTVYKCSFCGDDRTLAESVEGGFCSRACYYREKGENVLHNVAHDQRWCGTCFCPAKEIEMPPVRLLNKNTETARAMMGFQYPTIQTEWVISARDSANEYAPIEHQRWGCACGAVDPSTRSPILQNVDPAGTLVSLLECLRELHAEDNVAHAPSKDALFAAYRERPLDWPYITGRAIYDD